MPTRCRSRCRSRAAAPGAAASASSRSARAGMRSRPARSPRPICRLDFRLACQAQHRIDRHGRRVRDHPAADAHPRVLRRRADDRDRPGRDARRACHPLRRHPHRPAARARARPRGRHRHDDRRLPADRPADRPGRGGRGAREPPALRRQRRDVADLVRGRPPWRDAGGAPPRPEPDAARHVPRARHRPPRGLRGDDVANSTMRDLFFDLDIAPIGEMPYKSTTERAVLEGRADSTWLSRRPTRSACSCIRTAASSARRSSRAMSAATSARTSWPSASGSARGSACSSTSARTPRSW